MKFDNVRVFHCRGEILLLGASCGSDSFGHFEKYKEQKSISYNIMTSNETTKDLHYLQIYLLYYYIYYY